MNCHECAIEGEAVAAVATCRHCGAGLCADDLREALSYQTNPTLASTKREIGAGRRRGRALAVTT
jgi:hypothetical protein